MDGIFKINFLCGLKVPHPTPAPGDRVVSIVSDLYLSYLIDILLAIIAKRESH